MVKHRLFWSCICCLISIGLMAQSPEEVKERKPLAVRLGQVFESGSIGVGYEHGWLPIYTTEALPTGNFKTQGMLGFSLWKVPLQMNYRYSTAGALTGINNYFTLRFDAQRYRQQLKQDLAEQQLERLSSLEELKAQRSALAQRLGYLDAIHAPVHQIDPSWKGPNPDSSEIALPNAMLPSDSLDLPSLEAPNMSAEEQAEYQRMQRQLEQVDQKIFRMEQLSQINTDSLVNHGQGRTLLPGMNRAQKVMNGFQQFELGMCYPDQYTFLADRMPIRGINMAYQLNEFQLFFTHGKTLQPLYSARGLLQNQMLPEGNRFSSFDLNNVDNGRRITAIKGGYGAPDETHLYAGMLFGLGKASYWDSTSTEEEKNRVFELDGQWKISEMQRLSVVWGRSHVQITNPILSEEENSAQNRLFDLGDRTHALMVRHGAAFSKTKTELTTMVRWVDPYFKSHGVGFMRTDNLRYRVDVKQAIGSKLKLGGFVSREENNLLKLYDYTTRMFSYGLNGQYRPVRSLSLKASFQPLVMTVDQEGQQMTDANRNWIMHAAANWFKRKEDRSVLISAIYSRFQFGQEDVYFHYDNAQLLTVWTLSEMINNESSYNFFHTNDTIGNRNTHLIQNDITFQKDKVTTTLMAKVALTPDENQIGYGVSASCKLWKALVLSATLEKIVLGEYYNNFGTTSQNGIPYYASLELLFQW